MNANSLRRNHSTDSHNQLPNVAPDHDRTTVEDEPSASRGDCILFDRGEAVLYRLYLQSRHCDCVLRLAGGRTLAVHASLLAAAVPYFEALFTSQQNNATSSAHAHSDHKNLLPVKREALLSDIEYDTMQLVLQHVYTDNVNITGENVIAVLHAADYFNYEHLLETVYNYIEDQLEPSNCFGVRRLAQYYSAKELENRIKDFIMFHFVEIARCSQNHELLELSADELGEILGADDLNVKSEETIWQTIVQWIEHDYSNRIQYMPDLLVHLRRGLLDKDFFEHVLQTHPYVTLNGKCQMLMDETRQFFARIETGGEDNILTAPTQTDLTSTPKLAQPRYPHEILFALGGWSGHNPTDCIETYDTRADRWIPVQEVDPKGARAYHGTVVRGNQIYVIGGFDGARRFNSCRRFDAVNHSWHEVAPMHEQRCYVSVAALNGLIYAMGGSDGYMRHRTVERYDPSVNQWTLVASMCVQRSDASATALDGRIYICGGFNGQDCLNTCEFYDPDTDTWTLLPPMRSRRSGVSCVAFHNQLYVVGGFNGILRLSSAEKYSIESDTWMAIPDMYTPRSNFAIDVIDDMIFVIGGYNGSTTTVQVECYDEDKNEWYEATDMGINRSALSACVIARLPNRMDYVHKHRDRLLEEKRLRHITSHEQQQQPQPQTSSEESID